LPLLLEKAYVPDDLDLLILEKMIEDSTITFKELAVLTKTDPRTIAKRFEQLRRMGIVRGATINVDWSKLGLGATAYIGTATRGEEIRQKLFEFIEHEPRVLEAYTTLGSHEYSMTVLDTSMELLRAEICDKLEPLTTGLSTSIVVKPIKHADHKGLLEYVRRNRKRTST
jgi:Lrp/AsnC family transcriptional regulator for asnA, asnC and gidA